MKHILIAIFALISLSSAAQDVDCSSIKEGEFVIKDAVNGDLYITRVGNLQTEYHPKSGTKLVLKVKWIDDCTYQLKVKKVIANPAKVKYPRRIKMYAKVLKVTKKGYSISVKSDGSDEVLKYEVKKRK